MKTGRDSVFPGPAVVAIPIHHLEDGVVGAAIEPICPTEVPLVVERGNRTKGDLVSLKELVSHLPSRVPRAGAHMLADIID